MKIINIAGARPNFMKIAPLIQAMEAHGDIEPVLVHTGQHYDSVMSKVFFDELGIPEPQVNLEVGPGERLSQIERIMQRFEPVFLKENPDVVLVVGDVNSTIACARVASKHGCLVAHVEAGLRSFDTDMPEEINRVETDQLSDLLFVTEPSGMQNLEREGVKGEAHFVGNVMIDSLISHLEKARVLNTPGHHGLTRGGYFVGTFHRPSNVDAKPNLKGILDIIEHICRQTRMVLPLHPRTRNSLEQHSLLDRLQKIDGLTLTEPLGYLEFLSLVDGAKAVVTDSGGIQEETTYLQVPCITMRDNTERPITVDAGSNVLAGTDQRAVMHAIDEVFAGRCKIGSNPELWDGHAAQRIVASLYERVT